MLKIFILIFLIIDVKYGIKNNREQMEINSRDVINP